MTSRWCKSAERPIDPASSRNPKPPALAGGCLLLALLAFPLRAQLTIDPSFIVISPNPATEDESVEVFVDTGLISCYNRIESRAVSIDGREITFSFLAVPVDLPVCGTPPPLLFSETVGPLSAGTYDLTIRGQYEEMELASVTTQLSVLPASRSVPLSGGLPMMIMLMVTGLIALATRFKRAPERPA